MKLSGRRTKNRRDGCGFVVLTCVFTCFFLILNSVLVAEFYSWLASNGPAIARRDGVAQIVLFIGPIVMLFFEWWLVDFAVDLLTPNPTSRKSRNGSN